MIEAPERTIAVTARTEVSLAMMFTGQQQLCEELEDKWSTDHGTNEPFVREAKVVGD